MAALATEVHRRSTPGQRAPDGRGNDLLEEWALWMRGGLPGGSAGEWSVRERLDPPHEDDMPQKVLVVEGIVGRLGIEYPVYRRLTKHYWIGLEHPWQIAGVLQLTEGFVWMSLRAVAEHVDRQYESLTFDET